MAKLEDITPNSMVRGIIPEKIVEAVSVKWHGENSIELTYKDPDGNLECGVFYRDIEVQIEIADGLSKLSMDADGRIFRLVFEAYRIRLAHLYDPLQAITSSNIEPYPHQITAVYEEMLPRRPLRFLLADDPGAGKTIMAGLYIKELIIRGDVKRCLIVCPGNLVEQWMRELDSRFHLHFNIMSNDSLMYAKSRNYFIENDLVIARLDKLSRDTELQNKLMDSEAMWDLIVCDEAHKMSASYYGSEIKQTKRHQLGKKLSAITRHFLLMSATPHNGKEDDFQLFLSLLDNDRFKGKIRNRNNQVDYSDLMRRMVKENLLTFESTPLFPQRVAQTVSYSLSETESKLYEAVTSYVRNEFNKAETLANNKQSNNIGFALTILQRRLASSPEAIYRSLRRRRIRLENLITEFEEMYQRTGKVNTADVIKFVDEDDIENLDDVPEHERENTVEQILDQATTALSVDELRAEVNQLIELEKKAEIVRKTGEDKKWQELANLLQSIFSNEFDVYKLARELGIDKIDENFEGQFQNKKLIIFTEHTDTLNYLTDRISTLLGDSNAVTAIYGKVKPAERLRIQEAFWSDSNVKVLVATDAAGEGINLQCAHLMVNYDLPWNPNRLEQRFGRIHRIGQKSVCFLWNLVAKNTREGEVYSILLDKLEQARKSLGGKVFDVVGSMIFDGKPLQELLIKAIRFDSQQKTKNYLNTRIAGALDLSHFKALTENSLVIDSKLNSTQIHEVKMNLERAEVRRMQPFYIESFFKEAFKELGGQMNKIDSIGFKINFLPSVLGNSDRSGYFGEPLKQKYERIVFDKKYLDDNNNSELVSMGHPLLESVIDSMLNKYTELLKTGCILVDEASESEHPKIIFCIKHVIQDGRRNKSGKRQSISSSLYFIEIDNEGQIEQLNYAPYLDYRPLTGNDPSVNEILNDKACVWLRDEIDEKIQIYAIEKVIPTHMREVTDSRLGVVNKIEQAVKERLTSEITYWDRQSEELKAKVKTGKSSEKAAQEARNMADQLQNRLSKRISELQLEKNFSPLPPEIIGKFIVVPQNFLAKFSTEQQNPSQKVTNKQEAAARARQIVMDYEKKLGNIPKDVEEEKLGYDIESADPKSGDIRFIEVKGRIENAKVITVTKNEILFSLNKPENYILAIVEFKGQNHEGDHQIHYLRDPFQQEPDFDVTSVNYDFSKLIARAETL